MLQSSLQSAVGGLALLMVLLAGVVTGNAGEPSDRPQSADRLTGDAARMYAAVKTPHPGELKWQQIPWLTDLQEGIRQAKAESRPLVLFVSGDDPLEKC